MADETPLSIAHPEIPAVGGVVVLQEAFGVTEHIEDVCQRLADAGWLAVAPHLFHRTGDPILPYDDFSPGGAPRRRAHAATASWPMSTRPSAFVEGAGFPADTAGVVGFCMGGTLALATAVERQVGAAVTYYGSGILKGRFGFPPLVELAPLPAGPVAGAVRRRGRRHPGRPGRAARARPPRAPRCAPRCVGTPARGTGSTAT